MSRRNLLALSGAAALTTLVSKASAAPVAGGGAWADFHLWAERQATYDLKGSNDLFGEFECWGEMDIRAGRGNAVLKDQRGDQIVGNVRCGVDEQGVAQFLFTWQNLVRMSDGATYQSTGPYGGNLPGGLTTVPGIIAILIGMLLPAIQKVR